MNDSRELDVLFAEKVAGWKVGKLTSDNKYRWPFGAPGASGLKTLAGLNVYPVPYFSTRRSDAMTVFDVFPGEVRLVKGPEFFHCRIQKPGVIRCARSIPEFAEAKERTSAMAMVVAGLRAVGVKVNGK